MDQDWLVDIPSKSITHEPSGARFSFYNYVDPQHLQSPSWENPGNEWDKYYESLEQMRQAATKLYRAALKLPPL